MGRLCILSFLLLSLAAAPAAQTPATVKAVPPKADYSQEAAVIEQYSCKEKFENDGTYSVEQTGRVKLQSEAGLQRYGVLTLSYPSATSSFEIGYVRVRKPDGSVVETPAENVQDMPAEITRQAPFYSDLHEKHIAVKGLSAGDTLEYRVVEHVTKPLAPGQFWTAYRFTDDVIVLDEEFEVSVPHDRAIKIKSPAVAPVTSDANGYRIYTWHHSNLQHKDEKNEKREGTERLWQVARGRLPQPDVMMSSFTTWEEVGRWYGGLQEERVKPTPEIAAKAAELTKGAPDAEAKLRALYGYVSTQFRYIGVAFGIGRYQPHSATDVLENQYGDCKDKHTLLASLLSAAGIPAYPALISSTNEVDADVPSPGQFNHVITVVPRGNSLVWLDATTEVGPYQYLISPLRDKHALVVWKDKPALVSTPADLPYPSTQTFSMDAKLNDADVLEGHAEFSARGDFEFLLRSAFRNVPMPQWKELGQQISQGSGFAGEVSEVTASSPEKTDEPFHYSYKYTRKDFGDWPNRRVLSPSPSISLPSPGDEELLPPGPLWLGTSVDIQFQSHLELPGGYRPELPAAIHLKEDFAQYDSIYDFKDGKLTNERHLKTLMKEVPANERDKYIKFTKTLQDDYGTFIPLTGGPGISMAGETSPSESTGIALRSLPDSPNEEALRLEKEARDKVVNHDLQGAVSSLYRAVAADPKFTRAWVILGGVLLMQKQKDAGIDAFHKAMAIDPQPAITKALGYSLMAAGQFEDAVPVWRDYVKAQPEDLDGQANLGNCLLGLKKYSEAAAAFAMAAKNEHDRGNMQAKLASAYLLAGERDKAATAYRKLAELDTSPSSLNNSAYEMANADLELPVALDYAKKAAHAAEDDSQKITLPDLTMKDVRKVFTVAAYWDTLGWVNERMSKLDEAEEYLRASWKLTQDGVVAGHLCHVYRREHKTEQAIQMCRIAVYRIPMQEGIRADESATEVAAAKENLDHLSPGASKSKNTEGAVDLVIRERTYDLPRFLPGTESAEFFVLLAADGQSKTFKVEDTKFVSGSDKMKLQGKQLKTINFSFPAPSGALTRVVRRGILGCYQYSGCSFVLFDPVAVKSLD